MIGWKVGWRVGRGVDDAGGTVDAVGAAIVGGTVGAGGGVKLGASVGVAAPQAAENRYRMSRAKFKLRTFLW